MSLNSAVGVLAFAAKMFVSFENTWRSLGVSVLSYVILTCKMFCICAECFDDS